MASDIAKTSVPAVAWAARRATMMLAFSLASALTPALVSAEPPASTQDGDVRRAARELAREGARRYDAGEWEGARELFERAYRLVPAPTLALREARALVRMGRLTDALEAYKRASSTPVDAQSPDAFRHAVADAQRELMELRARIPRLFVTVVGVDRSATGLQVALDGEPMPASLLGVERPLLPGMHVIEATMPGLHVIETVMLDEGETRKVALRLETRPPARGLPPTEDAAPDAAPRAANPWPVIGWTTLGGGVAALAFGVTTGVLAADRKSDLDVACPNDECPRSASDDLSEYRTLRTASTIGYVAGGVAAASGLTILILSAGSKHNEPSVQTRVHAGGASVFGRF